MIDHTHSGNFSIRYLHYYFLYSALLLIFLLNRDEIISLLMLWFSPLSNLIGKGPAIWSLTFLFINFTYNRESLFNRNITLIDFIYTAVFLFLIWVVKPEFPQLVPVILIGAVWLFGVQKKHHALVFISIFFLAFSLPYLQMLKPYLQSLAVIVVESSLGLISIPVLVQEYYIAIPRGLFEVHESCSGLGYLAINLILLYLYSLLSRYNLRQFALALLSTIVFSLLINWIRIFIIVAAAHYYGFDVPFIVDGHQNFGWVIYVFFLIPFFYTFLKIERIEFQNLTLWQKFSDIKLRFPSILLLLPIFIYSTMSHNA